MKKQARPFVLGCLFATGCCWAVSARVLAQVEDPRITKIFADWKKRQDAIKVVRYRLEGKSVIPKGSFVEGVAMKPRHPPAPAQDIEAKVSKTLLVDFSRRRFRFETDEPEYDEDTNKLYPAVTIKVFDGKTGKQLRPRELNTHPRSDLKPTTAELGIGKGYFGGASFDRRWFPLFLGHGSVPCEGGEGITIAKLIVQPDRDMVYVHGEAVHQGRACWILRTQARKKSVTSFTEFWVDKGRDSAVLRHAYLMNGVPREDFDVRYRQTKHGWLPEKWTYIARNLWNKGSAKHLESMEVLALTVEPTLDDAEFDIVIKPGMLTAEITYAEPPPGEPPYRGKSETKLIRIEKNGTRQEVQIVDGVETQVGSSWSRLWMPFLIVAAIFLACFVCWRLSRNRVNKR